jgi:predicted adenine nucleotide alpha hydrolase (AANH) superfamily ATPase
MRLALHACCGPCLLEPYDALAADTDAIAVVYANPNIHGLDEYERRLDTLQAYAGERGISVRELDYEPALWMREAGRFGDDKRQRCRACYRLRLRMTAEWAAEHGYDAIATTLTVSPYQDAEAIREEGERAAAEAGIIYAGRDFRDRYREATRRSRELGMYRQRYCGCVLSQVEAAEQDRRRDEPRRGQKEAARADG